MLTGEIRNQVDRIWDAFWSGGISNPLEVIEQITYLLFIKRLDDLHTLEELKATRLKTSIERRIFPEGKDNKGRAYEDSAGCGLRISHLLRCLLLWQIIYFPSSERSVEMNQPMPTT